METVTLQPAREDKVVENQNNESEYETDVTTTTNTETKCFKTVTTIEITESKESSELTDDIVILRRDPSTKRKVINKTAYAKLHRTVSPNRNNSTIENLKGKYENNKPDLIDVQSESDNTNKTEPIKVDGVIEPSYTSKRTSPVKLDEETVQTLKNKYSPANLGYPKTSRNSKLPIPKPRGAVKSQIILPSSKRSDKNKLRYSLDVDKKSNRKDENSNEVGRKNSSSSGEFISIITRSESEASVDKFEKELSLFTMDGKPKEKKRANSFRKIFSGRIFGKDKKKKDDEKHKAQYKENVTYSDNLQNENNAFNRRATYRHTTGGSSNVKPNEAKVTRSDSERFIQAKKVYITKDMEQKYAQMHINQFNQIKNTFENSDSASQSKQSYVPLDQPVVKNNPGPTSYMNLPSVKKYIDTSSSASTLESDKSIGYPGKGQTPRNDLEQKSDSSNTMTSIRFGEINKDGSRDTPPRAQELQKQQNVRLVNPKALIPINTERSLPNPYQNSESSSLDVLKITHIENVEKVKNQTQPHFEETYGTVFDSLESAREKNSGVLHKASPKLGDIKGIQKPPRSPSLENTKLKLPPNREIIPLSPRIKSPIPHDSVSTEKIIATELLKPTRSPTPTRRNSNKLSSPSHQKLEIDIDYPDNVSNERNEKHFENSIAISAKPPISKIRRSPETNSLGKQRISQHSPTLYTDNKSQTFPIAESHENIYVKYRGAQISPAVENQETITTNAMIHVNASKPRTPTPSNVLHNRSLSPIRPQSARSSTPVDVRMSPSAKTSPQKVDMRKSVEAYYWKEIKKLKEQENYDIYLYQMQMMPFGYAEDPVSIRRSRSLSPTSHRNSRRSLSLPREPRAPIALKDHTENPYGRMQPDSIPEGRAVVNQQIPQRSIIYGQVQEYQTSFRRNAPERRTIEDTPRSNHLLYKPIFKRGSLTTPVQEFPDDLQNKKVSFSSSRADVQSLHSWPTKNGFTQSPPQRRIDNRRNTLEDDVFLPPTPRMPSSNENGGYGYVNKPQYDFNHDGIYQRPKQNQEPAVYPANPISIRYRQEYVQPQGGYMFEEPAEAFPQGVIRPGSVQIQEPLYVQRQVVPRRMSYDNPVLVGQRRIPEPQYVNRQQTPPTPQAQRDPRYGFKREIIVTDEIFGQFGGYIPQTNNEERYFQNRHIQNPVYSSRQSVTEPVYGRSGPKQVSVRDKVCDMYGQIHDRDSPSLSSPNQIRKTGIILGELQSSPGSPQVVRQSYSHLPNEHFARNSRLTASANDMYRRYQNTDPRYRSDSVYGGTRLPYQDYGGAPTRPLPPVPVVDKKVHVRNNSGRSDTESASDASEMQKISGAKNKKRSFFGK